MDPKPDHTKRFYFTKRSGEGQEWLDLEVPPIAEGVSAKKEAITTPPSEKPTDSGPLRFPKGDGFFWTSGS